MITSFAALGPPGSQVRFPLRHAGPILPLAAAGRSIAADLTRDRRRRATDLLGDRPDTASCSRSTAISSRSANDSHRSVGGINALVGMPPPSRNQRVPTGPDTPHAAAASSLVRPSAIFTQNAALFQPATAQALAGAFIALELGAPGAHVARAVPFRARVAGLHHPSALPAADQALQQGGALRTAPPPSPRRGRKFETA